MDQFFEKQTTHGTTYSLGFIFSLTGPRDWPRSLASWNELKVKATQVLLPIQPGDVPATYADITRARTKLGFEPTTPIDIGIPRFIQWYLDYHHLPRP